MSMWYYMDGEIQQGPISENELHTLASSGRLRPDDLVWTEGMTEWNPARNLRGITWPSLPPRPPRSGHAAASPPSFNDSGSQRITNYLPWAIAVTLLCCVPTGIASIVYSTKATHAQSIGDYDAARKAADKAKLWLILSVPAGIITYALIILGSVE